MTSATTRTKQQRRHCSSSSNSSDGDSAQARTPLEQLTRVFKAHPSALQLHMALTRSLARGDAARAADLAATLAEVVQRMTTTDDGKDVNGVASQRQQRDTDTTCSNDKKSTHSTACGDDDSHAAVAAACDGVPMPTDDDVDGATDAVARTLHTRIHGTHPTALAPTDQDVVDDNNTTTTTTWSSSTSRDDVDALCRRAQLCVTLLESSFETVLPEDGNNNDDNDDKNKTGRRRAGGEAAVLSDAALRSAQHEAAELRLLDAYLTRDEAQWRAQKHAVTMVVLDTARTLGLTPRDLLVAEQEQQQQVTAHAGSLRQSSRLNVLRHCNLVVRGEVPSIVYERAVKQQQQKQQQQQQQCDKPDTDDAAVRARVDEEMRVLRQRMLAAGTPLSVDDERLARYELLLSHSRMRYVVGVHHSLQRALDNCDALRRAAAADTTTTRSADADAPMSGAQYFVTRVMRALHASADELEAQHNASPSSTAAAHATADDVTTTTTTTSSSALSAERIEAAGVLATPVLPFTFMLKCCLWFDVQQQQQQQSS